MAHAVESMFSVRETPWHNLGKVLQEAPTLAAAMQDAGLDWDVATSPVEWNGSQFPQFGKIVYRTTDRKPLGCVGPNWTPLQNSEAFDWFTPFVESGAVTLETAGSLHGGRTVWVMARVQGATQEVSKGDEVRAYLLLSNSHDGTAAVRVGFTPIRVVCANTLGFAHRDTQSALLRIRHTPGIVPTLQAVRDTVSVVTRGFVATSEQYRRLAQRRINRSDLRRYVKQVIVKDENNVTRQEEEKIEAACLAATQGFGNADSPLTLWTAYNGITEFLSYNAGRSQDTRLSSLWFGESKKLNDYAFQLAVSLSA